MNKVRKGEDLSSASRIQAKSLVPRDVMVHACSLSAGEMVTGRSLGLTSNPA